MPPKGHPGCMVKLLGTVVNSLGGLDQVGKAVGLELGQIVFPTRFDIPGAGNELGHRLLNEIGQVGQGVQIFFGLFLRELQHRQKLLRTVEEILLIALIVLLLFGGAKIPELMKGLGKGVKSFKDGMKEIDDEVKKADDEVKKTDE